MLERQTGSPATTIRSFSKSWRSHLPLIILLVCTLAAAAFPLIEASRVIGAAWQNIPLTADNYYYARIKEIKDGFPLIGNPYFFEHRTDVSPAFFAADWVASIPLLLGAPLIPTIIFNILFWSVVNTLLLYALFRTLKCPKPWATAGALLAYLGTFVLMTRPVSMQVIFPAFTLLCLTSFRWLERPLDRKRIAAMIGSLVLCVYLYTYLTQVALVFFGLAFLVFLLQRKWQEAKTLFVSLVIAGILSIPFALVLFRQLTNPNYWETMVRIGLENTHLPTFNAATNVLWVLVIVAAWWLLSRWTVADHDRALTQRSLNFFGLSGAALAVVSMVNVITGKELETAEHIDRFIALWVIIATISAISLFVRSGMLKHTASRRRVMIYASLAACLFGTGLYSYRLGFGVFLGSTFQGQLNELKDQQSVAKPLAWLEEHEPKPVVVWAPTDSPINDNVTIATKHYVLFSMGGILHLVSDKEVEERYLISNYFNNLTTQDIKRQYKTFAGAAYAVHMANTHNRAVKLCQLLHLNLFKIHCGEMTDSISLRGEEYFASLERQYQNEIVPNIASELKKFHVAYIVTDEKMHPNTPIEKISGLERVYEDERFRIYRIPK